MHDASPASVLMQATGADRWHQYGEVMADLGLTGPEPVARSRSPPGEAASSSGGANLQEVVGEQPPDIRRLADTFKELMFDCATRPGNFEPRRHTIYVLGRPVQVPFGCSATLLFEPVHDSQVSGLVLVLCPFVFAWLVLSQVLVLAHVAPDVEPLSPVIAYRLRPAPVLALYSRTARLEPRCQPKHAVFHAWKDCAACFVVRDPAGIFAQDQFSRKL